MKILFSSMLVMTYAITSFAQIDTVTFAEKAAHLFPSFPVRSSYTCLFDKRTGKHFVYSANMESGLGIYDISNPSSINLVLDFGLANSKNLDVSTIEQRGNLLYIGIGDFQANTNTSSGLSIVDITNPNVPILQDFWDSTIFDHGISHLIIEGNYAYLSTMTDGIIILDISDQNNIAFKAHLPLDLNFPAPSTNAHNARGLKYKQDTLYVCFDRGGLRTIDVTNKTNPKEIYKYINTSLNSQAAAAYNDIAIKGNYAFVSVDYCGLEIIDISTFPYKTVQWFNPWGCNKTNWSGANIHTNEILLSNNDSLLFVTAGQSEVLVFDVTNPLNVVKVGGFVNLQDTMATHGLDVLGNKIILSFIHTPFHIPPFTPFFADPGGLKLLNYSYNTASAAINKISPRAESVFIHPNPSYGGFLLLTSTSDIINVNMCNAVGEVVYSDYNLHKREYTMDIADLPTGIYILTIQTKQGITTKKIIKQV